MARKGHGHFPLSVDKEARTRAYAAGAKAINCTLAAFGPLRTVDPAALQRLLGALPEPGVNHDVGGRGRAGVTVTARTNAAHGTYRLLVFDEQSDGRGSVLVRVQGGTGARFGAPDTRAAAARGNPAIAALQQRLIELSCLPAANTNGASNADGASGPASDSALDAFLGATTTSRADFATVSGGAAPGEAGFNEPLTQMMDEARDNAVACAGR